jgi:uncharacterized UPF0160 family protein
VNVVRTRDEKILGSNQVDFVLDVGKIDLETEDKLRLDHHQKEPGSEEFYECGVKKAACGKLFDRIVDANLIEERYHIDPKYTDRVVDKIRQELLYPVESIDNGQKIDGLGKSYLSYVTVMNPPFDEVNPNFDFWFGETVDMTVTVVDNMIRRLIATVKAEDRVQKSVEAVDADGVVFLGDFAAWQDQAVEYNNTHALKATVIVFKATSGNWNAQVVPVEKFSTDSYVSFPEEWRGKDSEKLSEISGLGGAVFCHPSGFLSGWTSKESAIAAAHVAAKCWNEF